MTEKIKPVTTREINSIEQRITDRMESDGGLGKAEFEATRADFRRVLGDLTGNQKEALRAWLHSEYPDMEFVLANPVDAEYSSYGGPKLLRYNPGSYSADVRAYLDQLVDLEVPLDLRSDSRTGPVTGAVAKAIAQRIGADKLPDFVQKMLLDKNGLMFQPTGEGWQEMTKQLATTEKGKEFIRGPWLKSFDADDQEAVLEWAGLPLDAPAGTDRALPFQSALGPCKISAPKIFLWRDYMPTIGGRKNAGPDHGSPLYAVLTLSLDNSDNKKIEPLLWKAYVVADGKRNEIQLEPSDRSRQWTGGVGAGQKLDLEVITHSGPFLKTGTSAFVILEFQDQAGNTATIRTRSAKIIATS